MPDEVVSVADAEAARLLLDPMRRRLVALARTPLSAAQAAETLELSRQTVNYHVKALAKAGLLVPAGTVPRRGATERLYVAVSRAFVLSPGLLGELKAEPSGVADATSVAYALALSARALEETAKAHAEAVAAGKTTSTFATASDLRFRTAAERDAFSAALDAAFRDVVARHAASGAGALGAGGRAFRLAVLVHPVPER